MSTAFCDAHASAECSADGKTTRLPACAAPAYLQAAPDLCACLQQALRASPLPLPRPVALGCCGFDVVHCGARCRAVGPVPQHSWPSCGALKCGVGRHAALVFPLLVHLLMLLLLLAGSCTCRAQPAPVSMSVRALATVFSTTDLPHASACGVRSGNSQCHTDQTREGGHCLRQPS